MKLVLSVRRASVRWWLGVPMPREMSMFFGFVYATSFAIGITSLVRPSLTLQTIATPFLSGAIAVFLMVGAVISSWGGYRDYWALERIGLKLQLTAVSLYGFLTLVIGTDSSGAYPINPGWLVLGFAALLGRWVHVRVFTYRPGVCAHGLVVLD